MDVEQVVTELYGLRPARFVAARDAYVARARREKDTAGARRIGSLRKPTLALWAVGLFARARPGEAEGLLRLGAQLRTAHRELDGAQLRALSREQHKVIDALARDTVRLAAEAGERTTGSVLREVERILHALLTDEEAGRQWLAGRLTAAPRSPVGFEGVEPAPSAAAAARKPPEPAELPPEPRAKRRPEPEPPPPARDAAAERRAREREGRVRAARRAAAEAGAERERAEADLAEAAGALERARGEAEAAREGLRALQLRLEAAEKAEAAAQKYHHRAESAARKAGKAAEAAARRLRAEETGDE
ncbi:hypothetical protein ACWEPM_28885 [Streptomyces sp. NPDC004244]